MSSDATPDLTSKRKILVVLGTRPEAIKLAPVIRELRGRPEDFEVAVCCTAQHRDMMDQVLALFDLRCEHDLDIMAAGQTPTAVARILLERFEPVLAAEAPDWVMVQGDTTTAAVASLAAFYARCRVAHVEAGLRTNDKWRPFPEEINRRVAGVIADLHLAPTERARSNLLREGVPERTVVVTGNTVVDALHWAAALPTDDETAELLCRLDGAGLGNGSGAYRLILVTAHRRESFGAPLREICASLREIVQMSGRGVRVLFTVHPNPQVRRPVHELLSDVPGVILVPPLSYAQLVHVLKRSYLVLTDSGGLQEEAPSFAKPVLVLRDMTERTEGLEAGTARLVGTDRQVIVRETMRLLSDKDAYDRMAAATNPYGDGHASGRIAEAILAADRTGES